MLNNLCNKLLKSEYKKKEALSAYVFMLPTIIILGLFLLIPIFFAVALAFYKIQLLGEFSYKLRGWKNFIRILSDERVLIALKNTFFLVALAVLIIQL